jgi:zinc transport system permease protein
VFTRWLDAAINAITRLAPERSFFSYPWQVNGLLAVVLVCLICGAVGSLIVSNRMAFFSDALAHCAFAGVALGLLVGLFAGALKDGHYYQWGIPATMVIFGVLVGLAIAYVREKTTLANDTVIGVFFAGAIGFGAMLLKALSTRAFLNPENFLFGDPLLVDRADSVVLFLLALVTGGLLAWVYNQFVFTSFNLSLARSRQIRVRLCNYAFIVLLALIVNLSLKTVGALLINALLIVPAATANNLARNMRQMFWLTIGLCLLVGLAGPWLANELAIPNPVGGGELPLGWSGTIVVLSVLLFMASMVISPWVRGRQAA